MEVLDMLSSVGKYRLVGYFLGGLLIHLSMLSLTGEGQARAVDLINIAKSPYYPGRVELP